MSTPPGERASLSALECFDAGRSTTIKRALERILREIRTEVEAPCTALVLCSYDSDRQLIRVLAGGDNSGAASTLPNEPFLPGSWSIGRRAAMLPHLRLESALRAHRIALTRTVLVPWRHRDATLWLVLGFVDTSAARTILRLRECRDHARRVRDVHTLAALRAANDARGRVERAIHAASALDIEAENVEGLLDAIVTATRRLLRTSAAYITLPDENRFFAIAAAQNIRTAAFRRSGSSAGQGLGGLVVDRARPVYILDYAHDRRLTDPARVAETRREGLVSVICVPLIVDDVVTGLLYAANRKMTAFTPADVSLLQMFGDFVAPLVARAQAERLRFDAFRQRELDSLAFHFHESVVRALVEIGIEAEAAALASADDTTSKRFARIATTAQTSLATVRDQLARLTTADDTAGDMRVLEAVELLRSARVPDSLSRSFTVRGAAGQRTISRTAAMALFSIAQEAVQNADRHSGARSIAVDVDVAADAIRLTIADDGIGTEPREIEDALLDRKHFGLRQMRRRAEDAGGTARFSSSVRGGFRVEAMVPIG